MKKRNCRMTEEEKRIHERAIRIRRMSDGQLCEYIDGLEKDAAARNAEQQERLLRKFSEGVTQEMVIEKFIRALSIRENNSGVRLSDATIRKIRQVAVDKGFLRPES